MKILTFFICFLTLTCAWAQSFLPKTEDIPSMPGLNQIEEVANFDNPQERMLILSAITNKEKSEILKYYQTTLKNLGWEKIKENTFKRGKDTFQIEVNKVSNQTQIQFILTQE